MVEPEAASICHQAALLRTALLAAVPVTELRGAIPWGVFRYGLSPAWSLAAALVGNLVIIPPLMWLISRLVDSVSGWGRWGAPLRWWFARVERKSRLVERYGALGLALFVAVPLPGTGAWTGCAAAVLFRQPTRRACLAVAVGVVAAGLAITLVTWAVQQGLIQGGGPFLKEVLLPFDMAPPALLV